MSDDDLISPQQQREFADPHENRAPLPGVLKLLVGLMCAFGVGYIALSDLSTPAAWGDQRQLAELRPSAAAAAPAAAALDGAALFAARCAACHQANGQGIPAVFPPLAGSEWVQGAPATLAAIVLHGVTGPITVKGASYAGAMPAFKDQLSDAELAAVLTHVRGQWGNTSAPLTAAEVAAVRQHSASRSAPFAGQAELASLGR